ncbi:hypothetical protein F5Y04DRAFT_282018 [Hypomontagnella monticulosa]|nr:hypothetical protein F5Y04DRAFT_282018 [Hypomontagnella monticulosa]
MDPIIIWIEDSDDDEVQILSSTQIEHQTDRSFEDEQRDVEVTFFYPTDTHVTPRPGFLEGFPVPGAPNYPIPYTVAEKTAFPSRYSSGNSYEKYTNAFARLGLGDPTTDSSSRRSWDAVIASRNLTIRAMNCLILPDQELNKWLRRAEVEQGLRLATRHLSVWVPFGARFWSSPDETFGLKWDGDQREQYDRHNWMILPCNTRPGSEDGCHWQLVIFSKLRKTVYFGDSLGSITSEEANNVAINLRHFLINNGVEDPGVLQVVAMSFPQQRGHWQCGYIVIESARAFVHENGLMNWHKSRLYEGVQSEEEREITLLEHVECWSKIGYLDHEDAGNLAFLAAWNSV